MSENTTWLEVARDFIGHIAWRIFLWSIRMTDKEYDFIVHAGCTPHNGAAVCQHGYNGLCAECDAYNTPPERS